jgi:rhodanese-related sulfurtransferase
LLDLGDNWRLAAMSQESARAVNGMDTSMSQEAPGTETELDPKRASEIVAEGAELIDVRRDYEWEGGRIAGARHVEVNDLVSAADSIPRDRPVIFYCRSGSRSGMAAAAFREAGRDAYNMAGGLEAWVEDGLEIEPEDGEVRAPLPAT